MTVMVLSFNEERLLSIDDHVLTPEEIMMLEFCQKQSATGPVYPTGMISNFAVLKLMKLGVVQCVGNSSLTGQAGYELTTLGKKLPVYEE